MGKQGLLISALAVLALCGACIRRPEGVQSDKKMAEVVADLEIAEAAIHTSPAGANDDVRRALVDYVIAKHGLTREEFDTTMAWYGRNVDAYYELCDKVEKEIAVRRRDVSKGSQIQLESSDLWPYRRMAVISPQSNSNSFDFSIPTVDVEPGQRVEFKLRLNGNAEGTALLGVEYDNGTMEYIHRSLSPTNRLSMMLQTDSARTVGRVFGNLLVKESRQLPLWLDSISLTVLPFDSLEYYNIYGQKKYREPAVRRKPKFEESDLDGNDTDSIRKINGNNRR